MLIPFLGQHVVVLELGKDFQVFMGGRNQVMNFVLRVDAVHSVRVQHREGAQGSLRDEGALERAVGPGHIQPIRKQHIDLVDVVF